MSTLRDEILRFIMELRNAGVRVSVAETLDAMNAVAAAGLDRARMREAMAAALIKDEADRPTFDALFGGFFAGPRERGQTEAKRAGTQSSAAPGAMRSEGESFRAGKSREEPTPGGQPKTAKRSEKSAEAKTRAESEKNRESAETSGEKKQRTAERPSDTEPAENGIDAARRARLRVLERTPFENYGDLEYEEVRDLLPRLVRGFRVRLGRRLHRARIGRIDFRRTIRASIQRGGSLVDLRYRSPRPRRIDLLVLADVSGSVRHCAALMLELVAGARAHLSHVRCFAYIDRLAEADFVEGHLVTTPALDVYARSDFGRVLTELWDRREQLLNRATVAVILGDGRNNRRPARADLLREAARRCRAVLWLIPEEPARWGTGDSAILQYQREISTLLPSRNLEELERAMLKIA